MSDESNLPTVTLTWEAMLALNERAKNAPDPSTVMCGFLVWKGIRELVEERIARPMVGDIIMIDGQAWMMSMNVAMDQIMVIASDEIVIEVPLVIERGAIDL